MLLISLIILQLFSSNEKKNLLKVFILIEYEDIFILSKPFYNKPISYNN